MVGKGNYPQMAASFRLVNYYNLPIYIYMQGGALQVMFVGF